MPVTLVSETWSGAAGSGQTRDSRRVRVFDVIAERDGVNDVISQIKVHASIPGVGGVHPFIAGLYAQEVQVDEAGGPTKWRVTVPYAARTIAVDPLNPLSASPDVSWGSIETQVAIDTDLDSLPIATSAKEPFDPPITVPDADLLLTFVKNFAPATVTHSWLLGWKYKTNTAAVMNGGTTVAAIGEALILGVPEAVLVPSLESVAAYFRVTFRIAFRSGKGSSAWKRVILDQGYRTVDGSGNITTVCDQFNKPTNQPVLLDGSGGKLASGGTPVFKTFRVYDSVSYAGIGLVFP